MGLFSFFSKDKDNLPAFSFEALRCDMHNHLLPGIDDGAKTVDESIGMLLKMKGMGYSKWVFTPHIMQGMYPNTPERIHGAMQLLQAELERLQLALDISFAAEYFYDESLLERVQREELLTFSGKHLLFEFPFTNEPFKVEAFLKELRERHYIPVLAHFERYLYYHERPEMFAYYRGNGVRLQLNLLSLTGHYGPNVMRQARRMVDQEVVDFVATDAHRIQHLDILEKHRGDKYFRKLMDLNLINDKI